MRFQARSEKTNNNWKERNANTQTEKRRNPMPKHSCVVGKSTMNQSSTYTRHMTLATKFHTTTIATDDVGYSGVRVCETKCVSLNRNVHWSRFARSKYSSRLFSVNSQRRMLETAIEYARPYPVTRKKLKCKFKSDRIHWLQRCHSIANSEK